MKVISILSGGLDSTIMTYMLVDKFGAENVTAMSFEYGQTLNVEIDCARRTTEKLGIEHKIVDVTFIKDLAPNACALFTDSTVDVPTVTQVLGDPQPDTYVPCRNQLFTTIAMSFAESIHAEQIYLGIQSQDEYSYWDTTTYWLDAMNALSSLNRKHKMEIIGPWVKKTKADEIRIGVELGVPFEDTWSCYAGDHGEGACGVCPSCADRIANFILAKVKDPIPYIIGDRIPWVEE